MFKKYDFDTVNRQTPQIFELFSNFHHRPPFGTIMGGGGGGGM